VEGEGRSGRDISKVRFLYRRASTKPERWPGLQESGARLSTSLSTRLAGRSRLTLLIERSMATIGLVTMVLNLAGSLLGRAARAALLIQDRKENREREKLKVIGGVRKTRGGGASEEWERE